MDRKTPNEIQALQEAGNAGGQYIDMMKLDSFSVMTKEQWDNVVEAIVTGFCDGMRHRCGINGRESNMPPVGKIKSDEIPF